MQLHLEQSQMSSSTLRFKPGGTGQSKGSREKPHGVYIYASISFLL